MKKTLSIITSIAIISIISCIVLNFLLSDPNQRPKRPIESQKNKIVLTSNGCCVGVSNVVLTLIDNETNEERILCTEESITEMDVMKYDIPQLDENDYKLRLYCEIMYDDTYVFDDTILNISDYSEFRKNGLLLYFQEADGAYFNVITNDHHDTYKLLMNKENPWELKSEPNEVHERG